MMSGVWVLSQQQSYMPSNKVLKYNGADRKIHRFTDNSVYVYSSTGELENVFSYEKINDNGSLKISVENVFSHGIATYSVVATDFSLALIGVKDGEVNQYDFEPLKDVQLKNKIMTNNY